MNNRGTLIVILSDMYLSSGREQPTMKCIGKGWKIYHYNDKLATGRWLMADQNINMHYSNQTTLMLSQIIEENAP